jgi:hypothetical protein
MGKPPSKEKKVDHGLGLPVHKNTKASKMIHESLGGLVTDTLWQYNFTVHSRRLGVMLVR